MTISTVAPAARTDNGVLTVGVGDIAVTNEPSTLITHALGSCIGVVAVDPAAGVAGLLHYMLPSSSTNRQKAAANPAMFGDTGIPLLFHSLYSLGAEKSRLVVCAAGGAQMLNQEDRFRIGPRNRTILRKLFWKNNVMLSADETGGTISRTLVLDMPTGVVSMRHKGVEQQLWPEDHTGASSTRRAS